ncbi:class I SAM-dependent methyltransferase [Flavisolibacter sp. BT320]|nr:class I SAM-dependent methyltransferase [Flavisolibacter longurius]
MLKETIKKIPFLGKLALSFYSRYFVHRKFKGSAAYWEDRYRRGGDSGAGSYHLAAEYKAAFLNRFVHTQGIKSVIEFGCGDGNQLQYLDFPNYLGFDVSETVLSRCQEAYATDASKRFALASSYAHEKADLVLSLDVIYHLVEDTVYHGYMQTLFAASNRYVVIYSSNTGDNHYALKAAHVRNRIFTEWVEQHASSFRLIDHIRPPAPVESPSPQAVLTDFFVYEKICL